MHFNTKAIHVGQAPDPRTGAVVVPIYQTSTYAQRSPGEHTGYEYSRTQNPTREALEQAVAALEGGKHGHYYSSGMGATTTILSLLSAGDHVVSFDDVYGGTFRVFDKVFKRLGLEFDFVDARDPQVVRAAMRPNTKLIWLETPTNPLLKLADIAVIAEIAKAQDALLAVDNTFVSPYFQNPLALGADIVMHSSTKYLGGHSDVVGGITVTASDELGERLGFLRNATGTAGAPFDAWLTLRGVKTLGVRMDRHFENARKVAHFLQGHDRIDSVTYPWLESHPQHALATRQMGGMSGMITCEVKGGLANARRFLETVQIFTLAESLGGVESLIEHPAIMTHASVPVEQRIKLGFTDGLCRLSVGIEDAGDLIADLDQALAASASA